MSDTDRLVVALRAIRLEQMRRDRVLDQLVHLSTGLPEVQLGIHVTLLVQGTLVRGRTISEDASVRQLDADIAAGFNRTAMADVPAELAQTASQLADLFVDGGLISMVDGESRDRRRDLLKDWQDSGELEKLKTDWTTAEMSTALDYLLAVQSPATLSLEDASIFVGEMWQHIGHFRITLSHVSGWWPTTEG